MDVSAATKHARRKSTRFGRSSNELTACNTRELAIPQPHSFSYVTYCFKSSAAFPDGRQASWRTCQDKSLLVACSMGNTKRLQRIVRYKATERPAGYILHEQIGLKNACIAGAFSRKATIMPFVFL